MTMTAPPDALTAGRAEGRPHPGAAASSWSGWSSTTPASDPFPVTAMDAVGFVVGNATQTATFYQLALGMELEAYRGPGDRLPRLASPTCCAPARPASCSPAASPPTARSSTTTASTATASSTSRSRCPTSTSASTTRARWAPRSWRSRTTSPTSTAPSGSAAIATYGETRHTLVDRSRYDGPYLPGYVAAATTSGPPRGSPEAAVPGRRPLRRQRRARPDGRVGGVLQQGHGLHEHGRVHRRRHRHRLLRADVEGRRERQPPGEVPAQRAGDRQEEVADRRVPRVLRRRRLPAHRAGHQRHPAHASTSCATTASSSSTPPTPTTTTRSCAPGSARCGCRSRS